MDQVLAYELELVGSICPMELQWYNGSIRSESNSMIVSLRLRGDQCGREVHKSNVRTARDLQLQAQTLNKDRLRQQYKHHAKLPVFFKSIEQSI